MNEQKAVAVMLANIKGPKKKPSDLFDFAEACNVLKKKWGFSKMADYFKVSEYMLRQINKINDLNPEVRKLVKDNELGIEASYHLTRIDESKQSEAAGVMKGMTTDDIRTFVSILVKDKSLAVAKAKKILDRMRPKKIQMLVLPLNPEIFEKLQQFADKSNLGMHDFVLKIIEEHLNGEKQE